MTNSTYRTTYTRAATAEHQHADEQRGAHRRRRWPCSALVLRAAAGACSTRSARPQRGYHGVARCGSERPSPAPRGRCGAGAHRYPPEARRQPRRRALPRGRPRHGGRRRATVRTPPRVGCAARPPAAPSARRDSGDTIRVAVRAHSTECRTASTPGSPDQRSPGDGAAPERRESEPPPAIRPSPGDDAGHGAGSRASPPSPQHNSYL